MVATLKSTIYHKPEAAVLLHEMTDHLRSCLEKLDSVEDAKRALKLFTLEPAMVNRIDMRISQLADKLTLDDWVEVFNYKSVLRQRNVALLEICAYNIIKHQVASSKPLRLEHIQMCLLSCGVLNYHEETFYKFLVEQLRKLCEEQTSDVSNEWMKANEPFLKAIINSIGMLHLRDDKMLDALGRLIKSFPDRVHLGISFVQTCGALNYAPVDFAQIVSSLGDPVASGHFKIEENSRDRHNFLNYVWSLCALNHANSYLIASVLEKKFFDKIIFQGISSV